MARQVENEEGGKATLYTRADNLAIGEGRVSLKVVNGESRESGQATFSQEQALQLIRDLVETVIDLQQGKGNGVS